MVNKGMHESIKKKKILIGSRVFAILLLGMFGPIALIICIFLLI